MIIDKAKIQIVLRSNFFFWPDFHLTKFVYVFPEQFLTYGAVSIWKTYKKLKHMLHTMYKIQVTYKVVWPMDAK